jgi:hopanoid biosynthesis associated RND transporter like protein HpnN|tara:strand:+ start:2609 stop:5197 length:2589 start_codon:yes stop_codon:yes gene_type:complete
MYRRFLMIWTGFVISCPKRVLGAVAVITAAALYIAITHFSINSDTGKLIRQDTHWKQVYDRLSDVFPQYINNTFVVVSGQSLSAVSNVSKALEAQIAGNTKTFQLVYGPANDPFMDTHALMFLDPDDLDSLVSDLAEAQPFLTSIVRDPNLRGLFTLLSDALNGDEDLPVSLARIVNLLTDAIDSTLAGRSLPVAWRDEMVKRESDDTLYSIIFVQGRQNFGESLPSKTIIREIRSTIDSLEHPQKPLVNIRLTGQIPLDHGEIESAMQSAQMAGSIAAVLLVLILVFGVGSLRVIIATYLTMVIGLIWTSAYAILAVGQYNTISIVFLVMFIGLGVDFAIHLSLRYQEAISHHDKKDALIYTSTRVGPAISLCGITSALGFLAFVPTEYLGLAELGIISGGGMIIAVALSLTVVPAFFALVKDPAPVSRAPYLLLLSNLLYGYRRIIVAVTLMVAALVTYIARDAYFDYSTLSLKNPNSEAMTTFRELQREDVITDYAISYIAPDMSGAEEVKRRLLQLNSVSEVKIPLDYVPSEQDEKIYILEDADFMLASTFFSEVNKAPYSNLDRDKFIQDLLRASEAFSLENVEPELKQAVQRLNLSLTRLATSDSQVKQAFERSVIMPALEELEWLERAIAAQQIRLDDLPVKLRDRLISEQGEVMLTVTPSENIVPVKAMRRFATDVQSIIKDATGRPVVDLGIGEIVITAFRQAIAIAIGCIMIVLVLTLRSFIDAILVFIPLAMTTMITFAATVIIDMPLNMANVVVVPLIFGLGVDNGIHVVERFHESTDIRDLAESSTPRAVFLSTLTTLGTFGALSFSTHQGIYSIGVLLTCALSSLMLLTLISLPALLSLFSPARSARK